MQRARLRVLRADAMGMCFGVLDALERAAEVKEPRSVTIHGELVHNRTVLDDLRGRGFAVTGEAERAGVPGTPTVMITAHGVSEKERRRLRAAGKELVDTTCPLVTRVHHAARGLQDAGYHVLVIGRRGHVEVRGIVEDLDSYDVVERPADVKRYAHEHLGIVCQTTTPRDDVAAIRATIEIMNAGKEIRFLDTVCQPTKDRQAALERLLDRVDAVVVVGGANSNNTRRLVTRCRARGVEALHVQGAADLDPKWFKDYETVGLTAGTSTPAATIDDVHRALEALLVAGPCA